MNCYWCCKPAENSSGNRPIIVRPTDRPNYWPTQRPNHRPTTYKPWWQQTTTERPLRPWIRPTERPTNTWWYPSTTTSTARPTTTTQYWWYPSPTTSRPSNNYRPEIIEAKDNEITQDSSYFSPAFDVVFKFKQVKTSNNIKPLDDFVVIEDNYKPEIIEALV